MKQSELLRNLKKVADIIPAPLYWLDLNQQYLGINQAVLEVTNTVSYENNFAHKTPFDLYPLEIATNIVAHHQDVIQTETPLSTEESIKDVTTKITKYFSVVIEPFYDDSGKIMGTIGTSVEITAQKEAEILKKEKEIAEKNTALMNILSSSIAHEIRTPLAIAKINADIVQMSAILHELKESEEKKELFDRIGNIHQAIKECSQIVNMLLVKLSKIAKAETDEKDFEISSLSTAVEMALSEYPFRTHEKNKIHYKKMNKNLFYSGQPRLTKHVLFNLLRNAIRVINEAEKGEIFIECREGKEFNQLIFKDTALGIPADYICKIFEKFETTDFAQSGTGLGLAFCKLVMESYGGKIECRSTLGKFTEFILYFPVIKNPPATRKKS